VRVPLANHQQRQRQQGNHAAAVKEELGVEQDGERIQVGELVYRRHHGMGASWSLDITVKEEPGARVEQTSIMVSTGNANVFRASGWAHTSLL
jgi:hypothetical protein